MLQRVSIIYFFVMLLRKATQNSQFVFLVLNGTLTTFPLLPKHLSHQLLTIHGFLIVVFMLDLFRPSVTFRRCTDMADQAASLLYQQWTRRNELAFDHLESSSDLSEPDLSNKYLNPSDVGSPRIPLKDISNCEPLVFKAVACALTIKPCSKTQTSRICL